MPVRGLGVDAVELHPAAGTSEALVNCVVALILSVHPNQLGWVCAVLADDFDFLERGRSVSGVTGDGKAGGFAGEGCCGDNLTIPFVQRRLVHTDFDEAGLCAVHALAGFLDPPRGELSSRFGSGEVRKELVIGGGVESGVAPNLDAGGFRQASEQARIAANVVGGAVEKTDASEAPDLLESGKGSGECFVFAVTAKVDFVSAGEVAENMLVDEDVAVGASLEERGE